jgi:chemotaxis protein methyltransferase CheR
MDTLEYDFVKREILKLTGVDLACYKGPQMQRRLHTFLLRSGQPTWRSVFKLIGDDPLELAKLKDYLTINVSSFFRDPEKFRVLREAILPELFGGRALLSVWSAGCSCGPEPYSLAMLLSEATGPSARHYILATDISHSALAQAQAGGPYSAEDVANVPPTWLRRYFGRECGGYRVLDALRRQVTFRRHNLLSDPTEGRFDLIVCRNVTIYFTAEVKERLYKRLCSALRLGGVLFVGGTEIVSKASDIGFETAGISFYRRKGG